MSRCATGQGVSVPLCNRAKCYPVAQPDANISGLRIGTPRCATGCPVAQPGRLGIGTEHLHNNKRGDPVARRDGWRFTEWCLGVGGCSQLDGSLRSNRSAF